MREYPKIETIWDRDDKFKVIEGRWRKPEFALIDRWLITEKVDGTNTRIGYGYEAGPSVTLNGRTANAQMPTRLIEVLHSLFPADKLVEVFGDERGTEVELYGEGYGPKIQSGGIYRDDIGFRLFDVRVGEWWLNWPDVEDVATKLDIQTVPLLDLDQPMTVWDALEWVRNDALSLTAAEDSGKESKAEGVVARTDPLLCDRAGNRLLWKLKRKDLA